eukprot:317019_1
MNQKQYVLFMVLHPQQLTNPSNGSSGNDARITNDAYARDEPMSVIIQCWVTPLTAAQWADSRIIVSIISFDGLYHEWMFSYLSIHIRIILNCIIIVFKRR